jgi:hypothetical protein
MQLPTYTPLLISLPPLAMPCRETNVINHFQLYFLSPNLQSSLVYSALALHGMMYMYMWHHYSLVISHW